MQIHKNQIFFRFVASIAANFDQVAQFAIKMGSSSYPAPIYFTFVSILLR